MPIPAAAGIGLRGPHHDEFLDGGPAVPWLETHSENYFAEDGIPVQALERIRALPGRSDELVARAVHAYLEMLPTSLAELESAVAGDDAESAFTIAHGLTPNSTMVHLAFTEGLFAEQGLDILKPGSVGVIR